MSINAPEHIWILQTYFNFCIDLTVPKDLLTYFWSEPEPGTLNANSELAFGGV
jgi:hypothetical protein